MKLNTSWQALAIICVAIVLGGAVGTKLGMIVSLGTLLACEDQTNFVCKVVDGPYDAEEIAASATDQTMGATGALGDYLNGCMVTIVTAATGSFGIEDGTNTAFDDIGVIVGAATLVAGAPIWVPVNASATTAAGWEITTGAGAKAYCTGFFT